MDRKNPKQLLFQPGFETGTSNTCLAYYQHINLEWWLCCEFKDDIPWRIWSSCA